MLIQEAKKLARRILEEGFDALPGFGLLQRFKADLATDLIARYRAALPASIRLIV